MSGAHRRWLLVGLLVVLAAGGARAARWPEWAASAADDSYLERYADEDAVVALDAWEITLKEGERVGTRRWVVHVLGEDGVGHAVLTLPSNHFGSFERIRMWVRDPAGRTIRFSDEDGSLTSRVDMKILDETQILVLAPPGVRPGTKVAVQASLTRSAELPHDMFRVQQSIPVVRYVVQVETKDSWQVEPRVFQSEPHGARETASRWEFFDVPGRGTARGRYAPQPPRTLMALNYSAPGSRPPFATWAEVARWAMGLFRLPKTPSDAVRALAVELPSAPAPATVAAGVRAREVRYFGVELGWGGLRPRAPEVTLQRSFGDCKDKAQLMVSLLEGAGVTAYPVLIIAPSLGFVSDEVPSPVAFNHVVVAVPWNGPADEGMMVIDSPELGRLRIYDPTLSDRSGQDIPPHLEGATGLVLHPETRSLLRLPASEAEDNVVEAAHEWRFDDEGVLAGRTVFRYFGAMRVDLEDEGGGWIEATDLRDRTRRYLSDVLPDLQGLAATEIEQDDDGAWTYEAIYRADGVLAESGPVRALSLGTLLSHASIPQPDPEDESTEAYLPFRGILRESFEIVFTGYRPVGGLESFERSGTVGQTRVEVAATESGVRIQRELRLIDREITAADREAVQELRDALRRVNGQVVLFEATDADVQQAEIAPQRSDG